MTGKRIKKTTEPPDFVSINYDGIETDEQIEYCQHPVLFSFFQNAERANEKGRMIFGLSDDVCRKIGKDIECSEYTIKRTIYKLYKYGLLDKYSLIGSYTANPKIYTFNKEWMENFWA